LDEIEIENPGDAPNGSIDIRLICKFSGSEMIGDLLKFHELQIVER
jgi:hypothetical protein